MCLQITELNKAEAKQYLPETKGNRYYKLTCGGEDIVYLSAWKNRYHKVNTYIQPYFPKERTDAKAVFSFLKDYFSSPLQCMLESGDKRSAVLLGGGFKLARRCFEREYTKADLKRSITATDNVKVYSPEDGEYVTACKLLFENYAKNHEKINPLTAGFKEFAADLPESVYCAADGAKNGYAFIEENEVCYIGGSGNLENFFAGVLNKVFSNYQSVVFEADDVDAAAMQLKNMFNDTCDDSFDTYIYTGERHD